MEGERLLDAAEHGNLSDVISILETSPDLINFKSKYGWTAIDKASENDHLDVVKYLYEIQSTNDLKKEEVGRTGLYVASLRGHQKIIEFWIGKGADINSICSIDGFTALHRATRNGQFEIVKYLIDKGADVNVKDKHGYIAMDLIESDNSTTLDAIKILFQISHLIEQLKNYRHVLKPIIDNQTRDLTAETSLQQFCLQFNETSIGPRTSPRPSPTPTAQNIVYGVIILVLISVLIKAMRPCYRLFRTKSLDEPLPLDEGKVRISYELASEISSTVEEIEDTIEKLRRHDDDTGTASSSKGKEGEDGIQFQMKVRNSQKDSNTRSDPPKDNNELIWSFSTEDPSKKEKEIGEDDDKLKRIAASLLLDIKVASGDVRLKSDAVNHDTIIRIPDDTNKDFMILDLLSELNLERIFDEMEFSSMIEDDRIKELRRLILTRNKQDDVLKEDPHKIEISVLFQFFFWLLEELPPAYSEIIVNELLKIKQISLEMYKILSSHIQTMLLTVFKMAVWVIRKKYSFFDYNQAGYVYSYQSKMSLKH